MKPRLILDQILVRLAVADLRYPRLSIHRWVIRPIMVVTGLRVRTIVWPWHVEVRISTLPSSSRYEVPRPRSR